MDDLFYKLFNGEVGKVVEGDFFDFEDDRCVFKFEGREFKDVGKYENEIGLFLKEFEVDFLNDVVLFRNEDGDCEEGFVEKNGRVFFLDIINDFMCYELKEIS